MELFISYVVTGNDIQLCISKSMDGARQSLGRLLIGLIGEPPKKYKGMDVIAYANMLRDDVGNLAGDWGIKSIMLGEEISNDFTINTREFQYVLS
jgi:hypothetical protein